MIPIGQFDDTPNYGRVPELSEPPKRVTVPHKLTEARDPSVPDTFSRTAIAGLQQRSPLSDAFFSSDNIKYLQNEIRYRVYKVSEEKHVIDYQDEEELKLIMRGIYLQHATHREDELRQEVYELDEIVLQFCIKQIVIAIEHQASYLDSLKNPLSMMDRPVSVSKAGTRGSYKPENIKFF